MSSRRRPQIYDHRLIQLVQETRDPSIATTMGIPRSTVAGWLKRGPRPVTTAPAPDATVHELQRKLARVEKRCRRLASVLRLLFVLLRVLKPDLSHVRFCGPDKARLLRAVDCQGSAVWIHFSSPQTDPPGVSGKGGWGSWETGPGASGRTRSGRLEKRGSQLAPNGSTPPGQDALRV